MAFLPLSVYLQCFPLILFTFIPSLYLFIVFLLSPKQIVFFKKTFCFLIPHFCDATPTASRHNKKKTTNLNLQTADMSERPLAYSVLQSPAESFCSLMNYPAGVWTLTHTCTDMRAMNTCLGDEAVNLKASYITGVDSAA